MWKNGKEGDTEGNTEGDESWKEKTGDGRRLKRKKKTEPRKGGDAASLQGALRGHLAEV